MYKWNTENRCVWCDKIHNVIEFCDEFRAIMLKVVTESNKYAGRYDKINGTSYHRELGKGWMQQPD